MRRNACRWMDAGLLILNALALVGSRTFFKPCAASEDGSFMACHWAGQAVFGLTIIATILCAMCLLVRNSDGKAGLLAAMLPVSAVSMLMPGGLIRLCMMPDMRCRAVMQPCVIAFCAVSIVLTIADLLITLRGRKA